MKDLFNVYKEYPSLEEILNEYSKESNNFIPQDENVFGFWIQTLADIQFLDLELAGLTTSYKIDALNYTVKLSENADKEYIRNRIAHLDIVDNNQTFYSEIIDLFGDTNAYAFHNLYPYKGKFYPRIVRTIINTFKLKEDSIILDPYNGCGTTTHEASLMGLNSIGIDINPIGIIISDLKNELLFLEEREINFKIGELSDIFNRLREQKDFINNRTLFKLFLLIYFDTKDAFVRTTRYNSRGEKGLFIEKYNYIKDCYLKTKSILKKWNIEYKKAEIKEGNVLDLSKSNITDESIDAIITSPPYYFSLDYVGKDKIAYDYLNEIGFFDYDMQTVKNEYLGMKIKHGLPGRKLVEKKIITYYNDLETSIKEMVRVLKKNGKIAVVIGDSTVNGKKLPTTQKTKEFCLKFGLRHIKTVFNPLLGARNRAIRGESILLFEK